MDNDTGVLAAPWDLEGALTLEDAAQGLLDSEDETDEPEPAEPADEVEAAVDTADEAETDEAEESDDTLTESQSADDPIAKREKELVADYTRKTQKVAEELKAAEASATEYRAKRDDYAAAIQRINEYLEATKPPEPDWAKLRTENPAEYAAQWAERQRWEHDQAAFKAEADKLATEQAEERAEKAKAYQAEQMDRLLTAVPEWQDAAKFKEDGKALRDFGMEAYGISEEEFATISDARFVLMLRDAKVGRTAQSKTAEVVAKAQPTKVLKPGTRETALTGKDAEIARLRKRPSLTAKEAARLYELTSE